VCGCCCMAGSICQRSATAYDSCCMAAQLAVKSSCCCLSTFYWLISDS
jgi:hypothetical protein